MYKKFKLTNLILILVLAVFGSILSGCQFTLTTSKVETPSITMHSSSKCLTWGHVEKTKEYDVYCNNRYVDTVDVNQGLQSYLYDFSSELDSEGEYKFYIIGVASMKIMQDSDKSNVVTYKYTKAINNVYVPYDTSINKEQSLHEIEFTLNGTQLTYIPLEDEEIEGYEMYLYSQTSGLNTYPISDTTIELQSTDFSLLDEIYAVRLGVVVDDQHFVKSEIQYLNPDNYKGYTDKVYLFDGYINDYYIETLPELRNLIYYSLVYRMSNFDIKLSSSFQTNILSTYGGSNSSERLISAIGDSFSYLYETRNGYSLSCTNLDSSARTYKIYINYDQFLNSDGLPACDIRNVPSCDYYYDEIEWTPYYETCSYTMREDDEKYADSAYDNFSSDNKYLYTVVDSSEELYWAVENKVTPIVESGSMAETIYLKAKEVLNSIISDQMSDYEKVLSIFDWICANTSYDYYSLEKGSYSSTSVTIVPAYYLEGVFLTGYAVCDGFSKAFSLLCNMEGIYAIRIVGDAGYNGNTGGHAWNKVLLDKDPDDGINAQYYLVDITWTALISNDQETEVSTHSYFLISDRDVINTHFYYSKRDKFAYYTAEDNFDYYNQTTFEFDEKTYDLVLESDEEVEAFFEYLLKNTINMQEVVIDYDYMKKSYLENGGTTLGVMNYEKVVDSFIEQMRRSKFKNQAFLLHSDSWSVITYNDAGDTGVIIVFEQSLLIDESGDAGYMIVNMPSGIEGEINLEVELAMFDSESTDNYITQLKKMYSSELTAYDYILISILDGNIVINNTQTGYVFTIELVSNTPNYYNEIEFNMTIDTVV